MLFRSFLIASSVKLSSKSVSVLPSDDGFIFLFAGVSSSGSFFFDGLALKQINYVYSNAI